MRKFRIDQSRTETPTAGLALIGHCINRYTPLAKTARSIPKRHGIPNIDLFSTYAALMCVGKRQALFSVDRADEQDGEKQPWRLGVKLIERTIDGNGQLLITPEIELEGWTTSLPEPNVENAPLLPLYRGHALCEQFHSEFKTDLDLERLPAEKFDTNDLVMTFGALAYNILRWMGLRGLMGEHAPIRHPAKRRWLRTVMQELIYLAARVVRSARRLTLRFSHHCPGFEAFRQLHAEFP